MNILVTGIEGQVAKCLKQQAAGRTDITITFSGRPQLELSDPATITQVMNETQPDVVICAAAYTAVDKAEDEPELAKIINENAAGFLASAAANIGAKLIYISTDYVFDGNNENAYVETDATGPTGVYGRTKLAGENSVRAANPDHVIVRTAWVYSPFGSNFVKSMLRQANKRDEISVVSDQLGNPTSAFNIADGCLAICDTWKRGDLSNMGQVYHLAGTGVASWAEFAEAIFEVSSQLGGPSCKVDKITSSEFPTKAKRPKNSVLNSDKFENAFGYRCPPWRGEIEFVINHLIANDLSPTNSSIFE